MKLFPKSKPVAISCDILYYVTYPHNIISGISPLVAAREEKTEVIWKPWVPWYCRWFGLFCLFVLVEFPSSILCSTEAPLHCCEEEEGRRLLISVSFQGAWAQNIFPTCSNIRRPSHCIYCLSAEEDYQSSPFSYPVAVANVWSSMAPLCSSIPYPLVCQKKILISHPFTDGHLSDWENSFELAGYKASVEEPSEWLWGLLPTVIGPGLSYLQVFTSFCSNSSDLYTLILLHMDGHISSLLP